jgi:hypothetical protein
MIDPTIRITWFLNVIRAQVVSFTSHGRVKGFRNTFHWLFRIAESPNIIKIIPKRIIRTAVPFPFRTTVDSMNAIMPRNKTGYITWTVTFTNLNFTIRTEERNVNIIIIKNAITKIRVSLTSHTLYL